VDADNRLATSGVAVFKPESLTESMADILRLVPRHGIL
jgi:hypothetical protein